MGIVLKQSLKNTLTIYGAFAIGGINTLFLYTSFMEDTYYGLITFLLSTANLLMPFVAFGVQYTVVKFFSSYRDPIEKDKFLSFALILPLLVALPLGFLGSVFYESIAGFLAFENPIVKDYVWVIYLVAIATAYFEIFYAWAKVHLQSVFGNILKELFTRTVVTFLLFALYLTWIDTVSFIWILTFCYFIRMGIMAFYALKIYKPNFGFSLPKNIKEVLKYSFFIVLAGSAGTILLDIDKFMIPQKENIAYAAYYAVGVYIASVVETPGRAMSQIIQPLVAKALNEKNKVEVAVLYKKSSINLLLVSGLVFLLINCNITDLFLMMPEKFRGGAIVVMSISTAKLYHMVLGANGAIISNSKYYKILLPYGIAMAISVVVLNYFLIDLYGIDGAAFATLLVVLLFNTIKLVYVKFKFGIHPFSRKTLINIGLLFCMYFFFNFWRFNLHPLLNIILKCSILIPLYVVAVYYLKVSVDVNQSIEKIIQKIKD